VTAPRRTLAGYLLVPRRAEAVVKVWLVVLTALYARLALARGSPGPLAFTADLLVATVVLEALVYQARYTLNDLLGVRADRHHPGKAGRRLPAGPGGRVTRGVVTAVLAGVVVRLALAAATVRWVAAPGLRGVLLAGSVAVLVVAVPYDALRVASAARARAAVAAGAGPHDLLRTGPAAVTLFVLVGAGYAVRATVGLAVGAPGRVPGFLLALGGGCFAAFGSMFVTMTWAVDALNLLGRAARPSSGPPTWPMTRSLADYPHLGPLLGEIARERRGRPPVLRVADAWADGAAAPPGGGPGGRDLLRLRPLAGLGGLTWWNATFVGAFTAAAGLGAAIVDGAAARPSTAAVAAVGTVGALAVVRTGRVWALAGAISAVGAGGAIAAGVAGNAASWAAGAFPAACLGATYLAFRATTPAAVRFDPIDLLGPPAPSPGRAARP